MNTSSSSTELKQLLVVIPDLVTGGGERVTRQLIELLASRDYRIRLVSDVDEPLLTLLPLAGYRRLDWSCRLQRLLVIADELLRCDRNAHVLVVLTGPIILVGIINLLFRRKIIGYEHSDIEQLYLSSGDIKSYFRRLALRTAFYSVRSVAVVSEYLQERVPRVLGSDCDKFVVVRNPVQAFLQKLVCDPSPQSSSFLTAYIIGRNSIEKRHYEAIELLANCLRVQQIVLVARDAQTLRHQLSTQANAKLLILDCLAEISSFDTTSSFLFSYSSVESYSLVTAEWLASGLKVLTVDIEPMWRLWRHWCGAHFVPVQCSPAELEETLEYAFCEIQADTRLKFEPVTVQTSGDDLERLLSR